MDDVAREPVEMCKSGAHPRTPENTGKASTGRRFCKCCKADRAKERKRRFPTPKKVNPKDVILSRFQIERILASTPCLDCGAVPTRRSVGEDGQPRWLDAPVTLHSASCGVGARQEIIQRSRKSKGVAA